MRVEKNCGDILESESTGQAWRSGREFQNKPCNQSSLMAIGDSSGSSDSSGRLAGRHCSV